VGAALEAAAAALDRAGIPRPRLEAERLLAHVLETDRGGVVARRPDPLAPEAADRFENWVRRRTAREPLQHLTGEQEFFGLVFRVDPRVLVPRQETEGMVDAVLGLDLCPGDQVADLGTGSGCIAVALAVARPDLRIVALDRSEAALDLARANAVRHGVADRIRFVAGDFAAPPSGCRDGEFGAVVSNPPYVSRPEWEKLAPEVRDWEPREALVPGESGLEAYRALAPVARRLLRRDGSLVLELGYGRETGAADAVVAAGLEVVKVLPDLRGIPRVLVARRAELEDGS
jgi:release factor glutamine methyltransferase